jgi:hypothetical protein
MNYELKKFEEEFKSALQLDRHPGNLETGKLPESWALEEQERICAVFKEIVPGKDQALVNTYFFHQQQSLVFLLDRVFKEMLKIQGAQAQPEQRLSRLQEMLRALLNILAFMQSNLKPFFNAAGKVPECYIDSHRIQHQDNHSYIQQSLEARKTPDRLILLLMALLRFENGSADAEITFKQFNWVIRLQHELLAYLKNTEADENNQRLMNLLVSLNLNSAGFYLYCCERLRKNLDSELTVAEQYKKLASLKKRLNQLPELELAGYLPGQMSIRLLLLKFLKAEIKALNELEFIAQDLVNAGILTSNFKVSLSAKQLAFYVYLNVECGIIIAEKPKKLHEFIIDHVDSAQKHGLSLKSFKNNYYSHAPADVKKVEERLASMLALIREKFWMIGFTVSTLLSFSIHR